MFFQCLDHIFSASNLQFKKGEASSLSESQKKPDPIFCTLFFGHYFFRVKN